MSYKNSKNILSVSACILLAFAFVFGQTAWAGQNQGPQNKSDVNGKAPTQHSQASTSPVAPAKAQPVEEEEVTPQGNVPAGNSRAGGPHEGVKVHGHWTIEVRNPDGTVATQREFENALVPTGANTLVAFLGGSATMGYWEVDLEGGGQQPCIDSTGGGIPCFIVPVGYPAVSGVSYIFRNLTLSNSPGQLMLSGTATAGQVGIVSAVATRIYQCAPTNAPSSCTAGSTAVGFSVSDFTAASVPQGPLSVSTGQTIAVTVIISFS